MSQAPTLGQIIILNGAPRSGKSSIVAAIQDAFDGVWMNLGVDVFMQATPERYRPGIGLRPGGERPDLEPVVALLYAGLYESIAAHSRLGRSLWPWRGQSRSGPTAESSTGRSVQATRTVTSGMSRPP